MCTRYLPTLIATLSLWLPASLEASTFHCAAEDVACLIAAINTANTNGEPENTIRLAPGIYTLTAVDNTTQGPNGLPAITSALTIRADIDGSDVRIVRPTTAPPFRFLDAGSSARLTLDGIRLTGGKADTGAAIYSDSGTLTLSNTRIDNNGEGFSATVRTQGGRVTVTRSEFTANFGRALWVSAPELLQMEDTRFLNNSGFDTGGLVLEGGTAVLLRMTFDRNAGQGDSAVNIRNATVVIHDSTFFRNGPGILGATLGVSGTSTVDIVNSTFVGSFPTSLRNQGPVIRIASPSVVTLVNSTFAGNDAGTVFGSGPGSIFGNVNVQNTIVQHASALLPGDCPGKVLSLGHNLFDGGGTVCLHPTDVIGAAGLATFADTGEPGGGHVPLLAESVAIDAAETSACPATDQLGRSRTGPCDIGAVEFTGSTISASPATVTPGAAVTASWSGIVAPTANDWIALYVPGSVDRAYLAWIYVSCTNTPDVPAASGSCPLVVPSDLPSGTYELRLFANGGTGVYTRLALSDAFTVATGGGGGPTISASPATVAPGAAVTASWSGIGAPTANDWIALYGPGTVDEAYLTWVYVSCTTTPGAPAASGSCPLVVPSGLPSGTYELRLLANGGTGVYTRLAISNPFTVDTGGGGGPTISASPATVAPGAAVTASWSGISAPTPNDWIALYVPGSIHEAYLTWVYVSCTTTPGQATSAGSCSVVVPSTLPAGSYEIRLFSNGGTGIYTPLAMSNLIAVQ